MTELVISEGVNKCHPLTPGLALIERVSFKTTQFLLKLAAWLDDIHSRRIDVETQWHHVKQILQEFFTQHQRCAKTR